MVESYQKKQRELSSRIYRIQADIDIKQREKKVSTQSLKYLMNLAEEFEKTIDEMEKLIYEGKLSDLEDTVVKTIYDKLEKLESYEVRKELLEAVVSPEQGGYVKLAYDNDEKRHAIKLDAKLNHLRTSRIIEALKSGKLADNSFFNPHYLRRMP